MKLSLHSKKNCFCLIKCLSDHLVRLLLVVVVIQSMADRQLATARRDKPYCYPGNVRLTAAAAASLAPEYCDSAHHWISCPRNGISSLFHRLLKLVVTTSRHRKVDHVSYNPYVEFRKVCSIWNDRSQSPTMERLIDREWVNKLMKCRRLYANRLSA